MPEDQPRTAPVNIKSMPVDVWARMTQAKEKQGETTAEWLTRAINQLADREAGERYIPPGEAVGPGPITPSVREIRETIEHLARVLAGLSGVPNCGRVAQRLRRVMEQHIELLAVSPPGGAVLQLTHESTPNAGLPERVHAD